MQPLKSLGVYFLAVRSPKTQQQEKYRACIPLGPNLGGYKFPEFLITLLAIVRISAIFSDFVRFPVTRLTPWPLERYYARVNASKAWWHISPVYNFIALTRVIGRSSIVLTRSLKSNNGNSIDVFQISKSRRITCKSNQRR